MTLVLVLSAVLVLFDSYISFRRIKQYGRIAEVNMLVRQTIADFGLTAGITVGILYNIGLFTVLAYLGWVTVLWFLCGAKFGLALMQLKSMQMESFVERVLSSVQAKRKAINLTGPTVPPSTT